MQTFLAFPDFQQSLKYLDTKRLGNQRKETMQIITALHDPSYGWQNHPAIKMWRGYVPALIEYFNLNLLTWEEQGYKNDKYTFIPQYEPVVMPWWFGNWRFHWLHKRALECKWNGGAYYYIWPNNETRTFESGKFQFVN